MGSGENSSRHDAIGAAPSEFHYAHEYEVLKGAFSEVTPNHVSEKVFLQQTGVDLDDDQLDFVN